MNSENLTRRKFLEKAAWLSVGAALTLNPTPSESVGLKPSNDLQVQLLPNAKDLASGGKSIKLCCCDLNFIAPQG